MNGYQHEAFGHKQHGQWFTGSIRRKLTFFVVSLLLIVVGLFWMVSVYLLQPAYLNSLRTDLQALLDTTVALLDSAYEDGLDIVTTEVYPGGMRMRRLSDACQEMLADAESIGSLVVGQRCIDISDQSLNCLYLRDGLISRCLLHPVHQVAEDETTVSLQSEANSVLASWTREAVFTSGTYAHTLEENQQMVLGATAAGGQLAVVVSANVERVSQSVTILKRLMLPITLIIMGISLLAAWVFSHLFTRPLQRLRAATREMAGGNYDVQVQLYSNDEIGALGHDFNVMAAEVKRSAQLQKDLIANVSHDLRTPLTLIKGYAETVRDLTGDNPEKRTEQLNVIVDESDRLSALVGSVMELSRVSTGNEKMEPVTFDLGELCDEVAYRYNAVCEQQGYHFDFSAEAGCTVYADPTLIERALHNLLGNALNHVGEDGYIGLKVTDTGTHAVRVEVIDHGPGISQADIEHIFDRYYRSRADTGKPGTGLGLSITKAIFEGHGFAYGVQSAPGQGATFWFEVPLAKAPAGHK